MRGYAAEMHPVKSLRQNVQVNLVKIIFWFLGYIFLKHRFAYHYKRQIQILLIMLKAIPYKDCRSDAQSAFSSDYPKRRRNTGVFL